MRVLPYSLKERELHGGRYRRRRKSSVCLLCYKTELNGGKTEGNHRIQGGFCPSGKRDRETDRERGREKEYRGKESKGPIPLQFNFLSCDERQVCASHMYLFYASTCGTGS